MQNLKEFWFLLNSRNTVPEDRDEGRPGDGVDELALGREVLGDGVGPVHDLGDGDVQAAVGQHVDVVG